MHVLIIGSFKFGFPASRTHTDMVGSSVRRAANVRPAVPPPIRHPYPQQSPSCTRQKGILTDDDIVEGLAGHLFNLRRYHNLVNVM